MPNSGYISNTSGVHDQRWIDALRSCGFDPELLIVPEAGDQTDLKQIVVATFDPSLPVLAGPLDAVTRHLVGIPNRLVGLSWGYDLHRSRNSDASWITSLDALVVDSEATAAIARGIGVDSQDISVIPWGVDLDQFSPEPNPRTLEFMGIPNTFALIVSARAHEKIYHVEDVIRGFAQSTQARAEARLVITHEGSLSTSLKALVEDLQIQDHVTFTGWVSENELAALLRRAEVYVSASEVDGTSVTLLQAMACSCTCVVSDIPGNREWVIPGRSGLLFPQGDPARLGRTLDSALGAPTELGDAARSLVEQRADWQRNRQKLGPIMFPPET